MPESDITRVMCAHIQEIFFRELTKQQDILTGDELISDAYDIKEVDGAVYEVDSQVITIRPGVDVDIGANPSAEGGEDEPLEEGAEQVNNLVYSFRLQQTSMDKKSYMTYIKGYMKAVKAYLAEHSPDEVAAFEKGATTYIKKVLGSFKDYDFYIGESMDPDGMIALLNYREDGVTPYLIYWKHGLKGMKV